MALVMVMVAVSMSLVLTYSFISSQLVMQQISRNRQQGDWALQAAQTGATFALERIQSPDWSGVEEQLARDVFEQGGGTASFEVRFYPWETDELHPVVNALRMKLVSTGIWQADDDTDHVVKRAIEVAVELQPRAEGRSIVAGDCADAHDTADNPGEYDQIQTYTMFATGSGNSLVLDPCDCVEGSIWLKDDLQLYQDPEWSSSVRALFLTDVGQRMTAGGAHSYPHPLPGSLTFTYSPANSTITDLGNLQTAWSQNPTQPTAPQIDYSAWRAYRLFEGGFVYSAEPLAWYLNNVTLGPSTSNPLGIFYRSGNLYLGDDVTIVGTVVCSGQVFFQGDDCHLAGFPWRDGQGNLVVNSADLFRQLPTIVADSVQFDRDARVLVEGAIIVNSTLKGAGGDFQFRYVPTVNITGTATATPAGPPCSTVQLANTPDLSSVIAGGVYSIWLADADGLSGAWYPITAVDAGEHRLTVRGTIERTTAVSYRIRPTRERFVDLRGPLCGKQFDINRPPAWVLSNYYWNLLKSNWKKDNKELEDNGQPEIGFSTWLEQPGNFAAFSSWYRTYGLNLEPTFHHKPTPEISYQWSAPMFKPYAGTGETEQFAGYRWEVHTWRTLTTEAANEAAQH